MRLRPWPWPRAFLSLASRGSVLGRAVVGLGLGFFCVLGLGLGLEPCVLDSTQARSQDLKKGGGFFDRVKQLKATLIRILIAFESDSNGLSEIEAEFPAEIENSNDFSAQKQVISKKKRSSPKLRRIFRLISNASSAQITAIPLQLRHQIPSGGGCFHFLSKNRPQNTKNVQFCILFRPMGGLEPPAPTPWLRY